jgi:hypothetical protein
MKRSSVSFSLATWIACFAIMLATLAPSASHLIAGHIERTTPEPCRIAAACNQQGQPHQHAAAALADSSVPAQKSLHVKHCPFCNTTAAAFALLPTSVAILSGETGTDAEPLSPPLPPTTLSAWTDIQPRGPPAGIPRLS